MIEAAKEAEEKLVEPLFEFRNFDIQLPDNWYTVANGAEFGTDSHPHGGGQIQHPG